MSQVIVSATLKDLVVPATTVAGQFEVAIEDSSGTKTAQKVNAPTATFDNVVPGDYTASVQLLDSTGAPLGDKATAAFNVPAPATSTVQVPDIVTVSVDPSVGGPV